MWVVGPTLCDNFYLHLQRPTACVRLKENKHWLRKGESERISCNVEGGTGDGISVSIVSGIIEI